VKRKVNIKHKLIHLGGWASTVSVTIDLKPQLITHKSRFDGFDGRGLFFCYFSLNEQRKVKNHYRD